VFLSRSGNGGVSWVDVEVADHHFLPSPIGGLGQGYQGDNIAITSLGDTLWPFWMDNSSGIYQVWTSPIDATDPPTGVTSSMRPRSFALAQNAPNPFNPRTTIEFRLDRPQEVRMEIVDAQGRRVAEPWRGPAGAGVHRVPIDASGWPSGVYFYRLESADAVATRKMVLLK
jgi:hypothetical protein